MKTFLFWIYLLVSLFFAKRVDSANIVNFFFHDPTLFPLESDSVVSSIPAPQGNFGWILDILKIFQNEKPTIALDDEKVKAITTISVSHRKYPNSHVGKLLSFLSDRIFLNKGSIIIALKASVMATFGIKFSHQNNWLYMLRRISMWYQSRADYEILLDFTDYSYQSYGCTITGEGALLLSSISKKIEKQNDFESIFHRLSILLDAPCFPQSLKEYSLLISKELDAIINDMDNIIQNYNSTIYTTSSSTTTTNKLNFNLSNNSPIYASLIIELQNGITLLQSRQADAQLRIIRQDLLVAALECQGALSYWKKKVSSRTQVLRIPFPKYLALRFARIGRRVQIGMIDRMLTFTNFFSKSAAKSNGRISVPTTPPVTSSSSTYASYRNKLKLNLNKSDDDLLHYSGTSTGATGNLSNSNNINVLNSLNSIEKVIFLDELLKGLYQAIGMVQSHLEELTRIRIRVEQFQRHFQSHLNTNTSFFTAENGISSGSAANVENGVKYEQQFNGSEWLELRQWIDHSVTVSSTCLEALQLGCPPESTTSSPSTPCSSMTLIPATTATAASATATSSSTSFVQTVSPTLTGFPRYTADYVAIGSSDMRGGYLDVELQYDSNHNLKSIINTTTKEDNIDVDDVMPAKTLLRKLILPNELESNLSSLPIEFNDDDNITSSTASSSSVPLLSTSVILSTVLDTHSLSTLLQSRFLLPPFDIYENVILDSGDRITGISSWILYNVKKEGKKSGVSTTSGAMNKGYSKHPIYIGIVNKINNIIDSNLRSDAIISSLHDFNSSSSKYFTVMKLINELINQHHRPLNHSDHDNTLRWTRTINYIHSRRNAFMGPKYCPVDSIQTLIVKPGDVVVKSDNVNDDQDLESLTLVTYTNISSNQFCAGCSYYTICTFTQENISTTISTSTEKEFSLKTNNNNFIRMKVEIHTVCLPSRFRGFIEMGIINGVKAFFQQYLYKLTTRLAVIDDLETISNTTTFSSLIPIEGTSTTINASTTTTSTSTSTTSTSLQQKSDLAATVTDEIKLRTSQQFETQKCYVSMTLDHNTTTVLSKKGNVDTTDYPALVPLLPVDTNNNTSNNSNSNSNSNNNNNNSNNNNVTDKTKIELKGGYSMFASLAEGLFKSSSKPDSTSSSTTSSTMESTVSTLLKLQQHQQYLQINSCKLGKLLTSHDQLAGHFTARLYQLGLQPHVRNYNYRNSRMAFTTLLLRRSVSSALRALLWVMLWRGSREIAMRWREIVEVSETLKSNAGNVVTRRIVEPVSTIISDLLFNKKPALADKAALKDAQRSLIVMLSDFLERSDRESSGFGRSWFIFPFSRSKPKFTKEEKDRILEQLDMSPVSKEFEMLTRRSLPKLVSGEMIRLILLQLQFLKKEMLMAMNALDDLLGANQVTLQLLACIPAVIILRIARSTVLGFWDIIRSPYRVRLRTSRSVVRVLVKDGLRDISRQIDSLLMKELYLTGNEEGGGGEEGSRDMSTALNSFMLSNSHRQYSNDKRKRPHRWNEEELRIGQLYDTGISSESSSATQSSRGRRKGEVEEDYGKLLSALYQLQRLLVLHRTKFNLRALSNLQEDLRDVANARLGPRQSALILSRINNNVEELFSS